ncbi:MAG: hypothetical protein F6K45_21510 [Kamptonema sp. SIO1D9]|nr:hypothetical protein [Kamptonema sp. SIO1D9]
MPTFSYGEELQKKVQEFLEALLNFVDGELDDDWINAKVDFHWEEKDELKLAVDTTKAVLLLH